MSHDTWKGWIGVDLDGTLAEYNGWVSSSHIGTPVKKMVDRVKQWISEGHEVRIFTARIAPTSYLLNGQTREQCAKPIEDWCVKNLGVKLKITHEKDFARIQLWDDRCVQIIPNTGERADKKE